MTDSECVEFLQWALPRLHFRWRGFRKVRGQVRKRIDRRLQQLGLPDVSAYRRRLESDPQEWSMLDAACRITISRFYRDRAVFDHLGHTILPALARAAVARGQNCLRVLSAGCASGEEVYTMAILASSVGLAQSPGVTTKLLGTDASEQTLDRARQAEYPAGSLKDVPPAWFDEAFLRRGGHYVVRPELRRHVRFARQDVRRQLPDGPWDLVLCRNLVFTYFDESLQREVLRRIAARIVPGGVLVTGKQESLPDRIEGIVPYAGNLGTYRVWGAEAESGGRPAATSANRPGW